MSLINTQVQPFKTTAYRNGEFFEVTARVGLTPAIQDLQVPEMAPAAPPVPFRQKMRRLARRFR